MSHSPSPFIPEDKLNKTWHLAHSSPSHLILSFPKPTKFSLFKAKHELIK